MRSFVVESVMRREVQTRRRKTYSCYKQTTTRSTKHQPVRLLQLCISTKQIKLGHTLTVKYLLETLELTITTYLCTYLLVSGSYLIFNNISCGFGTKLLKQRSYLLTQLSWVQNDYYHFKILSSLYLCRQYVGRLRLPTVTFLRTANLCDARMK